MGDEEIKKEKQREKMKKWRAKQKENVDYIQRQKNYERERYLRRKDEIKTKRICDIAGKALVRKKWKELKRRQRLRVVSFF